MQEKTKKSAEALFLLLLIEEDSSDEGRELFVGLGVSELSSPTVVQFHKTGMGLVTKNDLGIAAGSLPVRALPGFPRSKRVFVIIPFLLDEDFVRASSHYFSCERITEMFLLCDSDLIHALFSCFFESAGDTDDTELCFKMSHNTKGNK